METLSYYQLMERCLAAEARVAELEETFKYPVAYITYKGYLIHAGDPKLKEYSDPTPLYEAP